MKLYKQTRLKAGIAGLALGLFAAAFAVVKSDPQINAEPPATTATPDYGGFFGGQRDGTSQPTPIPSTNPPPHTRTRAS